MYWNSTIAVLQRLNKLRVPLTAMLDDAIVTKASNCNLCLLAAQ